MTELENGIIALIVEETGIHRDLVRLDSSLAQDIGMEGDDAVDFFRKYGERFHVDLAALSDHWDQHFLPEGFVPPLGCFVAIGAGIVGGDALHVAVRRVPAWAFKIALIAVFCWIYAKFFNGSQDDRIPVTVQDLVNAATSGRWVKQYDASAVKMFRTL